MNELSHVGPSSSRFSNSTQLFDSAYYLDLLTNKGLLESDVALLSDPLGMEYAIRAVQDPMAFLNEFGWAMIKMGAIPALEPYGWRRNCAFVEPKY
ncbi:hypothetical protein AXG93_3061s1010 [Marchantia polymorpha subsp. ruderalis]|uniref:Plant heme peroxidase family profile domain-containing protein n=1 Tax=Marchantia polymorpha subsp. ruderalis TaxID=1480154 RepID=A0A176WM83_MARPO|nr:hypothetical protein AXG93_3061s1010 [Marchantia polymorpha subsp. ruderalis]